MNSIKTHRIVAIDGSFIVHKSYHRAKDLTPPSNPLTFPEADYKRALIEKSYEIAFQTTSIILSDLEAIGCAILLDVPSNGKMVNCLKNYDDSKDEKYEIINILKDMMMSNFNKLGLIVTGIPGIEADTVAYYLSNLSQRELSDIFNVKLPDYDAVELALVTADYDWEISVTDIASLYNPQKKTWCRSENMVEWCGHQNYRLSHISHRCLTSNKDGIIGVKGIGSAGSKLIRDRLYHDDAPCKPEISGGKSEVRNLNLVLDSWDHFCSLWNVVDQSWIYKMNYFDSIILCSVIIKAMLEKDVLARTYSGGNSEVILEMVTALAGNRAKMGPSKSRMMEYILRRKQYVS